MTITVSPSNHKPNTVLLNLRGGEGVKGVGAQGQGEEIGIAGLKMRHVGQPLFDQEVAALHVARQVLPVGRLRRERSVRWASSSVR